MQCVGRYLVLGIVLQKEVPRMNDTQNLLRLPPNITKPRIQGGQKKKKKGYQSSFRLITLSYSLVPATSPDHRGRAAAKTKLL